MNINNHEFYTSPEVEVIETPDQTLLCLSGGLNDMNREDGSEW